MPFQVNGHFRDLCNIGLYIGYSEGLCIVKYNIGVYLCNITGLQQGW